MILLGILPCLKRKCNSCRTRPSHTLFLSQHSFALHNVTYAAFDVKVHSTLLWQKGGPSLHIAMEWDGASILKQPMAAADVRYGVTCGLVWSGVKVLLHHTYLRHFRHCKLASQNRLNTRMGRHDTHRSEIDTLMTVNSVNHTVEMPIDLWDRALLNHLPICRVTSLEASLQRLSALHDIISNRVSLSCEGGLCTHLESLW